ncbi:MAG: hypothetical protein MZV70_61450 [Desulfobacterales bacterium]|nr:hypothetical protein [Desulfobacterales bacterium]
MRQIRGSRSTRCEPWREVVDGQATETKPENIATHIVVGGELRTSGTGELQPRCPARLRGMINGGTTLYSATNPSELETNIRQAFAAIRSGAASGFGGLGHILLARRRGRPLPGHLLAVGGWEDRLQNRLDRRGACAVCER